jgi:hypothetical protein
LPSVAEPSLWKRLRRSGLVLSSQQRFVVAAPVFS